MARRVDLRDDETVINNAYDRDVRNDQGTNWLPLLIIPLLLGGLLWGLQAYSQNARDDGSGQQFGVGGGPVVITPTPTISPTPIEISPTNMGQDTL